MPNMIPMADNTAALSMRVKPELLRLVFMPTPLAQPSCRSPGGGSPGGAVRGRPHPRPQPDGGWRVPGGPRSGVAGGGREPFSGAAAGGSKVGEDTQMGRKNPVKRGELAHIRRDRRAAAPGAGSAAARRESESPGGVAAPAP